MKKIIISLLLLSIQLFSQNNSGEITYNVYLGFDEGFSNSNALKEYYEKAQLGAKQITFLLQVNKESSFFKMNDLISNEEINFAKAFTEASTVYYTQENSKNLKQINNHFGSYLINYSTKTEWKLENETKVVGNYLCYKASSELVVKNKKGEFKYPIIAWYCPEIPLNYGPKGYYGLPGLILELQERNTVYGASNINLYTSEIVIEKPTDGMVVTQDEYNEIISKPPTF